MKKRTSYVLSGCLVLFIFLLAGTLSVLSGCFLEKPGELITSEKDLKIVSETYPTEIILYGDEMGLSTACHVKRIDSISEENLKTDEKYRFSVLVINDIYENAPVSDEELKLILSVIVQKKLHFFYFGKRLIQPIISKGNYTTDIVASYDMFFAVAHQPLETLTIMGVWTDEEQEIYEKKRSEILPEALLHTVVHEVIEPNT